MKRMFEKLRNFTSTVGGRVGLGLFLVAALVLLVYSIRDFGQSEGATATNERVFIDAENGKTFTYKIKIGDTFPIASPYTGKRTGYHAEACYWTKDGKIKKDPTYVLLNRYVDKPGPTFCPDCGRLVREMNDPPLEGADPPPTESEFKAKRTKFREDE
jgi:hypothetical protein